MFHLKVRHEKRSMSFIGATFFGWRDPTLLQIMQICAVFWREILQKAAETPLGLESVLQRFETQQFALVFLYQSITQ